MTGSDRDRRILPARRGKLAKERAALERLQFEQERETELIMSKDSGVQYAIVAAAYVVHA